MTRWDGMDRFDRNFERTQKAAIGVIIFSGLLMLLILAGLAWLVYVLLQHFGVI